MTEDVTGYYEDLDLVSWASCTLTLTDDQRFELCEEGWGDCGGTTRTLTGSYEVTSTSITLRGKQVEVSESDATRGIHNVHKKRSKETISIQITRGPIITLWFRGLLQEEHTLIQRPYGAYSGPFHPVGQILSRSFPRCQYSFSARARVTFQSPPQPLLEGTYQLSKDQIEIKWKDGTTHQGTFHGGYLTMGTDLYFPPPTEDHRIDGTYGLVRPDQTPSEAHIRFSSDRTFLEKGLLAELRQGCEGDRLDPPEGRGTYSIGPGWIDLHYKGRTVEHHEFCTLHPGALLSQPKAILINNVYLERRP